MEPVYDVQPEIFDYMVTHKTHSSPIAATSFDGHTFYLGHKVLRTIPPGLLVSVYQDGKWIPA